jgi:hypothetical protein
MLMTDNNLLDLAYISENAVRLSGVVKDVLMGEGFAVITVLTTKEVEGRFYPCNHTVKVRRGNRRYPEAGTSREGDILAVKGAIDHDQSIVPFLFFKTDGDLADPLAYKSENDVRLRGAIKSVSVQYEAAFITLLTAKEVEGAFQPCEHRVKVRNKNRAYVEASLSQQGDILALKGVIHPDKTIVPYLFFNETARKDRRIAHISDAAITARRRAPR